MSVLLTGTLPPGSALPSEASRHDPTNRSANGAGPAHPFESLPFVLSRTPSSLFVLIVIPSE